MKTWLLTLAENQKYWGNQGYENIPGASYSYDSFVANYKQVAVGDIIIERTGSWISGVSTIDEISVKRGSKEIFRCPNCGNSRLRKRKTISPEWICENGHEFSLPQVDSRQCLQCKVKYAVGYGALEKPLESKLIEPALISGNRMFAIQEVGLGNLFDLPDDRLMPLISYLKVLSDGKDATPAFSPQVRFTGNAREASSGISGSSTASNVVVGPHVEEAGELGKLHAFLSGCCAEDDTSTAAHNKTRLPISSVDFDQLNAEIDAASTLLSAPRLEISRLSPLMQLLEQVKNYLDVFIRNASASMGKATGAIAIAAVVEMSGMLDKLINILNVLMK